MKDVKGGSFLFLVLFCISGCGGFNEECPPHKLMYSNTWFQDAGTGWGGRQLGGEILLEEVCHWRQA